MSTTKNGAKPDPWANLLPSRRATGETFTRIVTSDTKAKVITIEAGFGQGKSTFLKAWAEHLKNEGETVIMFDAWKSDHSDDPLMAFVGALTKALPDRMTNTVKKKARESLVTLGKIGGKAVTSWVLREGAEDLSEWVAGLSEDKEFSASLEKITGDVGGKVSKAAQKALGTQLAKEFMREHQLPAQLANLRDALQHGKENKGRIIVLVDELDRCRPDYAVSLLEAIKHLFEVEGYVFVLMLNADQIEKTAARLFGAGDSGEPYLAKFVDFRLRLQSTADDRARFVELRASEIEFENRSGNPLFSGANMIRASKEMAGVSLLTLRQLDRVFLNVDIALKSDGPGAWDEALLVYFAMLRAIQRTPKLNAEADLLETGAKCVATLAIDEGLLESMVQEQRHKRNRGHFVMETRHQELCRKFARVFPATDQSKFWFPEYLDESLRKAKEWNAKHERLIDGAAAIVVDLNLAEGAVG